MPRTFWVMIASSCYDSGTGALGGLSGRGAGLLVAEQREGVTEVRSLQHLLQRQSPRGYAAWYHVGPRLWPP
jgi:hypothetical protein